MASISVCQHMPPGKQAPQRVFKVELVLCHVDSPEMRRLLAAHRVVTQRPGDPGAREFATFEAGMHYVEDTYLKASIS